MPWVLACLMLAISPYDQQTLWSVLDIGYFSKVALQEVG